MKIGIAARWLTFHDAVSNDVFGMFKTLKNEGFEVYIFNEKQHWKTWMHATKKINQAKEILTDPEDILIYHFTSGWDQGMKMLKQIRCKKIIRYHGITPSRFFKSISSSHEDRANRGYKMLVDLKNVNPECFFINSQYSGTELENAGIIGQKLHVVNPFHETDKLLELNANRRLKEKLAGVNNILTVGRIAPHKGHLSLVNAFSYYYHNHDSNSRLIILGKSNSQLKAYTDGVERLIRELGLSKQVLLLKGGSPRLLRTLYLSADIYVAPSEHEGFCVPVIEAMAHKVPIIGKSSTAIPETLNSSGLTWKSEDSTDLANTIHRLINDSKLAKELQERSWNSYNNKYRIRLIKSQLIRGINLIQNNPTSTQFHH